MRPVRHIALTQFYNYGLERPSGKQSQRRHTQTRGICARGKGRKGKTATIVEGFTCPEDELLEVAARLKTRFGTGGSARGGEILIQGDVAAKVKALLTEMGYKVK